MGSRAEIEAEDLLKIVLVLVVIWLALEVLGAAVGLVGATLDVIFGPLSSLIALVVVALIVLWFFDKI
ncbi:hypothetical protein ACFPJ5_15635 [Salinirubrum litoreum]|uniref:Uncharacterized protein n=2 Tax=Salinirubrum litoreum TaxID=1126234 RepID=A0ABD5REV2_9EURY